MGHIKRSIGIICFLVYQAIADEPDDLKNRIWRHPKDKFILYNHGDGSDQECGHDYEAYANRDDAVPNEIYEEWTLEDARREYYHGWKKRDNIPDTFGEPEDD